MAHLCFATSNPHVLQAGREALKEKQRNEKVKEIANALDVLSERNSNNLGSKLLLTFSSVYSFAFDASLCFLSIAEVVTTPH